MTQGNHHFIGGVWTPARDSDALVAINPAHGERVARFAQAQAVEVDAAVLAARKAFPGWAETPLEDRLALLKRVADGIAAAGDELAALITAQMGCPTSFCRAAQIGLPIGDIHTTIAAAERLHDETLGRSLVQKDPVGVVVAITPWNFPLHQIMAKVGPALAAGCTVVLKPSEVTPLDAAVMARIFDEAGAPAGVFNVVFGGRETGAALVSHPEVDMISFTGSTRGGRAVASAAAGDLKKLSLELGGKSANLILDDADLETVIPAALAQAFINSGQVCAALSRLIVPASQKARVEAIAAEAAKGWTLGDPTDPATRLGPLATHAQQAGVRQAIKDATGQGARILAGGLDIPESLAAGAYVAATVLSDVTSDAAIAQHETFGPVLTLLTYEGEDEAMRIANDTRYGLSGGVWSADEARAVAVARRLRTGQVVINGAGLDLAAPFGGVKQSGLGRENGAYGLEEFVAPKAITRPQA